MARIAIGGISHETNTFAPSKASYEAFTRRGAWPALTRGQALVDTVRGYKLPIAGFIENTLARGDELVPLLWAQAMPSSYVTKDAFERICGMLIDDLKSQRPYDAVYLCLHGAMVAEHLDDGDGEILARVRRVVGDNTRIVASLDSHANVTPAMMTLADLLIAFRTYPHIDLVETGQSVAYQLQRLIDGGRPLHKSFRQIPFIIPLQFQCTLMEPAKSIYLHVQAAEIGDVSSISFALGFPAADVHDCGPAVFAYASTKAAAAQAVDRIVDEIVAREAEWTGKIFEPDEAVQYCMRRATMFRQPMTIADTQDNPGAGGSGDTTGMLRALIRQNAQDAVLGFICDAQAAAEAHRAGIGATINTALGGKFGIEGDAPFVGSFQVESLGSGDVFGTGPIFGGGQITLGPTACLRIAGVRIAVSSNKVAPNDIALFEHLGIDVRGAKILVLKSSVHFRAVFQPISAEVIVAAAPGAMLADTSRYPWKRLRTGLRVAPNGRPFVQNDPGMWSSDVPRGEA